MAAKDIVAENGRDAIGADEVSAKDEGVGEAARLVLMDAGKFEPYIGAIAEQTLEQVLILRRGDDRDIANAGEHQHRKRVIDFVKHRQQML